MRRYFLFLTVISAVIGSAAVAEPAMRTSMLDSVRMEGPINQATTCNPRRQRCS